MTISKSQNKLLKSQSVNLISKLNQNISNEKTNNINTSTKNSLNADLSSQNINIKKNKKEIDEEKILTKEIIFEKLKIVEIYTIKICYYSCMGLILILLIYSLIKLYEAFIYFNEAQSLFDDYSIVTFEYSMIINYFNNMKLLMINQPMGNEDFMRGMQNRVEEQFKKSEKVKQKSIKNYPKINKLFTKLNNEENPDEILNALCLDDFFCALMFNSEYNIVKKGIDFGLKSIAQEIYNLFKDFLVLKNNIKEIEDANKYLITDTFI